MSINIGIEEDARKAIAGALGVLLADTYILYIKSHGYHWNVTGPMFRTLHLMFEEEYLELRDAVDVIAERIRSLDEFAPGTSREFVALTGLSEADGVPDALEMVRDLAAGHEAVSRTAKALVTLAEEAGDVATADLATQRAEVHEKTAWMLRATAS